MILQPSQNPGAYERHLLRRNDNVLFGENRANPDQENLQQAQQQDHEALLSFHQQFQELLSESINLKSNVDSDVVLKLKDRLDALYEQACTIADDQSETKAAIVQLLGIVMNAIRIGAGDDPQAQQELAQEQQAREAHFALLESSLVADLLSPDSPIHKDELVPVLLSADKEQLPLALQIFDQDQLTSLLPEADILLKTLDETDPTVQAAQQNLTFMQGYIHFLDQNQGGN